MTRTPSNELLHTFGIITQVTEDAKVRMLGFFPCYPGGWKLQASSPAALGLTQSITNATKGDAVSALQATKSSALIYTC
jgi:hypothetical protein